MSYSGYTRVLCKNGHLHLYDCWDGFDPTAAASLCRFCGEPVAWWENVDTTNGEGEETPLEINSRETFCTCSQCGDVHTKQKATYKIPPKGVGHHKDDYHG